MPTNPTPIDRSTHPRRSEYLSNYPPDDFIVPLLRDWIEEAIRDVVHYPRTVLDVGCGRQPFRALVEDCGGIYFGMDVHQNPEERVDYLSPIDGSLPQNLVERPPFDVVLCTEVLEHVADWHMAFSNLSTLLARGGCAVITCPHVYKLHETPYDYWRPTNYAIEWHAHRVGLTVVKGNCLGNAWDVLGGALGSIHPVPCCPTLPMRMIGRLVRFSIHRLLFPLLKSRWLHARFEPGGGLYVANAAMLTKI